MDRTACLDTAASPFSRLPGFPGSPDSSRCTSVSGAQTEVETPQVVSTPAQEGEPSGSADSPDSTLHSLELARLRLTHDSGLEPAVLRSPPVANDLACSSNGGDSNSSRGSANGNDDFPLHFPSRLAVRPFIDAGLLSRPLIAAVPRDGKDAGHKSIRTEASSPQKLQQHKPQQQLRSGPLLRSFSDPSGSKAALQGALIAYQQLEDIPCLAVQPAREHQATSTTNNGPTELEEEPSGQPSAAAADVGASLSRMLLLREGAYCPSPSAHHQLPVANSQSAVVSSTAVYNHSDTALASTWESTELHQSSPRTYQPLSNRGDCADITQSPTCQQSDDINMQMSPRQHQVADPGEPICSSLDAEGVLLYRVSTFGDFRVLLPSISNRPQQLQPE